MNRLSPAFESALAADFTGRAVWVDLNGLIWRLEDKRVVDGGCVVRDEDGYLHQVDFPAMDGVAVESLAGTISAVAGICRERSISFIYAQAPYKVLPGLTRFREGLTENANRNADLLLASLRSRGVPAIDLRARLLAEWSEPATAFYTTDHHWTTPAAWWAARAIAGELALIYPGGAALVLPAESGMESRVWKGRFLGSLGVRTGRLYAGIDDLTVMVPRGDTGSYEMTILQEGTVARRSGAFLETFVDLPLLESPYVNAYNAFLHAAYVEARIEAGGRPKGPRVLVVADSFGRSFVPFVALGAGSVAYIDPQPGRFGGSVGEYVARYAPDIVIVMFTTSIPAIPLRLE